LPDLQFRLRVKRLVKKNVRFDMAGTTPKQNDLVKRAWRKIMPAIARHYTVVCPDLRGNGDTSKPEAGYDSRTMAEDVRQLAEQLGYSSYYLVAHDMGGPVAYALAAAYPKQVLKLVCLDTAAPQTYQGLMNNVHLWHFGFFMQTRKTCGGTAEFLETPAQQNFA
jgi:pimeloyl-ACP methyl ester carboxylesterase